MRAHQIMTRDVITVTPHTTIGEAAKIMLETRISGLPVMDDAGRLVGIVSESDFLRRSDATWAQLAARIPAFESVPQDVRRLLEIRAKYEGYIARQDRQIERAAHWETKLIPDSINYATITGLRNEARQKLTTFTPRSLGQALRISGITPADVMVLAIHLDRATR